jgi:pimeloyl-ACP methyl ester carboxylesterase
LTRPAADQGPATHSALHRLTDTVVARWARAVECIQATKVASWVPTSPGALAQSEEDLLAAFVTQGKRTRTRTAAPLSPALARGSARASESTLHGVQVVRASSLARPPRRAVVLTHGFGAGLGLFAMQLDPLAAAFGRVLAVDWPGFGLSPRLGSDAVAPFLGTSVRDAERWFLDPFRAWLAACEVDEFVLVGHSMGGYLSAVEALERHEARGRQASAGPGKLRGVVMLSPFGMAGLPHGAGRISDRAPRAIRKLVRRIEDRETSGQAMIRALGPAGPPLIRRARRGMSAGFAARLAELDGASGAATPPSGAGQKHISVHAQRAHAMVANFAFHVNAQPGSWETGERAFAHLGEGITWARDPLASRIQAARGLGVPAALLYGDRDWMDPRPALRLASALPAAAGVTVEIVPNAGHNLMIDNPEETNAAIIRHAERFFS